MREFQGIRGASAGDFGVADILALTLEVPDIREPLVPLFPEVRARPASLFLGGGERSLPAFAKDQDELVFQSDVCAAGQHAGSHELVRGIRLLAPNDGGHGLEAMSETSSEDAGVVRVDREIISDRASRIADVHAQEATWCEQSRSFRPNTVEDGVHSFERSPTISLVEAASHFRRVPSEECVPHLDHGIGRRRDNELDAAIPDVGHLSRVARDDPMGRFEDRGVRHGHQSNTAEKLIRPSPERMDWKERLRWALTEAAARESATKLQLAASTSIVP